MKKQTLPKTFPFGEITITWKAFNCLEREEVYQMLRYHATRRRKHCDGTPVAKPLQTGREFFTPYRDKKGMLWWIWTEADRSKTTIFLPTDYQPGRHL